ncbi:MAG: hypothetical protein QXD89_00635 [Candidatus Aenigmatarchaeota archaeon]
MIEYILTLLITLLGLYKASEILVNELENFAYYYRISRFGIGFIFLAVATSLPELAMSTISSILKRGDLGIGIALGNIIYNVLLIFGIVAIFYGLNIEEKRNKKIEKISLISLISLFPLLFLKTASYIYGITLIIVFILSSRFLITENDKNKYRYFTLRYRFQNKILLSISLILTIFLSYITIIIGKQIVEITKISATFFGAIFMSFFSSIPELFSSLVAAKNKRYDLIYGAVFGTLLFDSTFTSGISMIFSFYKIETYFYLIYFFLFLSLLTINHFLQNRSKIWISEGLYLLLIFIFYIVLSIIFI